MALTAARIGPFLVKSSLGEGGMGVVFRALDTKLQREVALKLLPDHFADDPERLARFQREAQVLASLNHPNIAQIYGLEESDNTRCIVMELVEGETLQERLKRGPIPLDEALPIAKQIAEALEAAHERGTVHRDLKPANIKLTPDGKVKVLDFGLAKLTETASSPADSPTLLTGSRVILGTAAYMSPEQAQGQPVDRRTDIFAFGCVLYEMLTGRRAFEGSDTVTAEPDWSRLPARTPWLIRRSLRRALTKDPRQRLGDIRDARLEIEEVATPLPLEEAATLPARRVRAAWIVATLIFATAAGLMVVPTLHYVGETPPEPSPEIRVEVNTPPTTDPLSFAISPNGKRLVFLASNEGKFQLWVRPLDSLAPQPLAGTEGASFPFWSPDSASVGFFAAGKLKRVGIVGGAPQVLADAPAGLGGTWNRDGIIVFTPVATGPLFKVSAAAGGEPAAVTRLETGQTNHRFPHFLPDGRHLVYFVFGGPGQGVYLSSLDAASSRRLAGADVGTAVPSAGFLLFPRQAALFAQAFDFRKRELSGNPFPLAETVAFDGGLNVAGISAAAGVVAYRTGVAGARQLTWLDRSGKVVGTVGDLDTASLTDAELSADGKRVAVQRTVSGNGDVWLIEAARGVPKRFTFDASADVHPIWSPDGNRVVFQSNRTGVFNLYTKRSSGAGMEEVLLDSNQAKSPNDWSADGRFLLFRSVDPQTGFDLWVLPVSGDKKPFPLLRTPFQENLGQFSPDGKWIAYQSNESGRFEIDVQPFPGPGGKFQISSNGGTQPRWNRNGKEIFYVSLDNKVMAAPVKLSPDGQSLETGTPAVLFPVRIAGGPLPGVNRQQYSVSSDGQRFLVNLAVDEGAASPITLILNWKAKP